MHIDERKTLLLLLGILCGIFITSVVIKNQSNTTKVLTYSQYQSLSSQKNQLEAQNKLLEQQVAELRSKYYGYTVGSNNGDEIENVKKNIQQELYAAQLLGGMTSVKGQGISITMDDNPYYNEDNVSDSIVHDRDIYDVVYELINSGAEAIAINGNRIVSTTSITCEGPVVKVNDELIVTPIEILAIGDSQAMQAYMLKSEIYRYIVSRSLRINITVRNDISLPAFIEYESSSDKTKN